MTDHIAAPDRYQHDHYRRVGRSGLRLPAISLGFWNNFGDRNPFDSQRAIVLRAFDLGITHFDLANNYGPEPGAAERTLGRVMASDLRHYRDEIIVSTKAGYSMWDGPYGDWGSRKHMLASLDQSLTRLGLDHVDIYYSHRPDPNTPIEETMGALASAVRAGKAVYVGVSNYTPEQTLAAHHALENEGVPLLIHQPRYNMLDRLPEAGLFSTLHDLGIGAIAFSPLAQGLLTDRYLHGIPNDSRAAQGRWLNERNITPDYLQRIRRLQQIADARGQSIAQLALSWILRHDVMSSALIGASSTKQLETNIATLDQPRLAADELTAIDSILE